ncbi:MAG: GGDEF domain-containing protein [Lachnospiraceae bacterium]|nr:GGDEF domain-containing protein [Lachnospiraceae bacterium]
MEPNIFKQIKDVITGQRVVSQMVKLELVTIGITIVHVIMLLMFVHFNVWPMIIYNGIVVAYYLYVLRTVHIGNVITGYVMTFVEITIQVILGTFMLGWDVGFFTYLMAIIPLFFYLTVLDDDVEKSVYPPLIQTLAAIVVMIVSYVISNRFDPAFVLEDGQVHALFIYNAVFSVILLAAMSHFFVTERRFTTIAMQKENEKLDLEASVDPLTGLTNRRSMEKHLENAMLEAKRRGRIYSLVMGDIDYFKIINDNYGHEFGDEALKAVAKIFRDNVTEDDCICRWGGEEFLILIMDSHEKATSVAEAIRSGVEKNTVMHNGKEIRFTMTLGVTSYKPGYSLETLIQQADNNLYYGKRHGRNQVVSREY